MLNNTLDLFQLSKEELLNLRICDLPLKIEGTWLQECIKELYKELEGRGIKFKPIFYLADEWFTPDREPIVGIPFFLAHPVLMKLEKEIMYEVEGGNKDWCMKLLRHETGHAINYAYKLYRRRKWQKIFGAFTKEYPSVYRFKPYSRSFVRHLEDYYAQYHPDEDFSETFAVWITLGSQWRQYYKGWKASIKLLYVEELMEEIRDKEPLVKRGKKYWHLPSLRITLKNYYKKKRRIYIHDFPGFYDESLKKIFLPQGQVLFTISAGEFIKKYKKDILNLIAYWTDEKKYIILWLLDMIIKRCKKLSLVVDNSEEKTLAELLIYLTTLVMNYKYTARFIKHE